MQRRKRMNSTEGKSLMKNYAIEETSKLAIKYYCRGQAEVFEWMRYPCDFVWQLRELNFILANKFPLLRHFRSREHSRCLPKFTIKTFAGFLRLCVAAHFLDFSVKMSSSQTCIMKLNITLKLIASVKSVTYVNIVNIFKRSIRSI